MKAWMAAIVALMSGLGLGGAALGVAAVPVPAQGAAPAATSVARGLPVGAATGFPFSYARVDGRKLSLLPPTTAGVDRARVDHAPRLGPFKISLKKGFSGWPSACRLTDAAQLKALFPAITGVRGRPVGTQVQLPGQARPTRQDTHCTFTLGTTFEPPGYSSYSNVQVQLFEVGPSTPSRWASDLAAQHAEAKKYPTDYAYYPRLENGAKCFDDGTELHCLVGDIDYWVSGEKVTSGAYFSSDQSVWVDQVEIPLAEMLGRELLSVR